ncbi:MAG: oxaloacetate decarboxylase subunit alpha, partial [Bacilli bacterium]|nr:oxaloacetate decarboxylase subunit alpha [Bacilli bacterium]
EVITYRPADKIEPQFEMYKEKYKDLIKSDEDVLTCALFEAKAVKFLTQRNNPDEIIEVNLYIG